MEYMLNSVNAVSLTTSVEALGSALSRSTTAILAPVQRLVPEQLLGSLTTMDPRMVVIVGLVAVAVMLSIGYSALFSS
jgi:hypothetical protein